ncbi:hypothetical protein LZ32DRAFT_664518 [Colletotrichum eremochloae]|nr:hypothetical protein LZ32DRAFT_664518 [Colletotrichum eremochloae]
MQISKFIATAYCLSLTIATPVPSNDVVKALQDRDQISCPAPPQIAQDNSIFGRVATFIANRETVKQCKEQQKREEAEKAARAKELKRREVVEKAYRAVQQRKREEAALQKRDVTITCPPTPQFAPCNSFFGLAATIIANHEANEACKKQAKEQAKGGK